MVEALWTSADVISATGGHSRTNWSAGGVSIDSRSVNREDLFVAIKGPNFDGHDFVAAAMKAGAAAAIVSRQPQDVNSCERLLIVANTMEALRGLATSARTRTGACIIAITGSVGKTGTKDGLREALARQGATTANVNSYNNHWGVPLSLSRLPADDHFGVFEVGMNSAGEIEPLSRLLRPNVAIITSVEPAHIKFFESLEAIADAKAEIFVGMEGGTAILNRDNPMFDRLIAAAKVNDIERFINFGEHHEADARLLSWTADEVGNRVSAKILGEEINYRTGAQGKHIAINSLAVLAAVSAIGADVSAAAAALQYWEPSSGRGKRHKINFEGGVFTLIDESYNANPASMKAAINTLRASQPGPEGRRIAVLGEMHELGDRSTQYHIEIAGQLAEYGIDKVFACGDHMSPMIDALPPNVSGTYAENSEALVAEVRNSVRPGDVLVIKGSFGTQMKRVVESLLNLSTSATTTRK